MADAEGHVLGNFHAYYRFNPAHERLRFMDRDTGAALRAALLTNSNSSGAKEDGESDTVATIMDVGCNEGDLTIGLYEALMGQRKRPTDETDSFDETSASVLNEFVQKAKQQLEFGVKENVDAESRRRFVCELRIDGNLVCTSEGMSKKVAKAKAASIALQSLREPVMTGNDATMAASDDAPMDVTLSLGDDQRKSLAVFGVDVDAQLISKASMKVTALRQDDAIEFAHANVMDASFRTSVDAFLGGVGRSQTGTRREFDIITLFSVTMWIHLNHGDDGLWTFLERVAAMTTHLIVEVQPWKSYRNALKRLNRMRVPVPSTFGSLKVREDVVDKIDAFLLDGGRFRYKAQLGKTSRSRPIVLYSRAPIAGIAYEKR